MHTAPVPRSHTLHREEPIGRLSRVVFAASEAWRRGVADIKPSLADLPNALAAKCPLCAFSLSGAELLALAAITPANSESAMLKRLRSGQCARPGCTSSHYELFFYDVPPVGWAVLLSPSKSSEPAPVAPLSHAPVITLPNHWRKPAQLAGAVCLCLFVWGWWQWRTGGRIPYLREPEHFRVTPAVETAANHLD